MRSLKYSMLFYPHMGTENSYHEDDGFKELHNHLHRLETDKSFERRDRRIGQRYGMYSYLERIGFNMRFVFGFSMECELTAEGIQEKVREDFRNLKWQRIINAVREYEDIYGEPLLAIVPNTNPVKYKLSEDQLIYCVMDKNKISYST